MSVFGCVLMGLCVLLVAVDRADCDRADERRALFDRLPLSHRHLRPDPSKSLMTEHQHRASSEDAMDAAVRDGSVVFPDQQDELSVARRSLPAGPARNCSSCLERELFLNFTKEELRSEILRKLGMKSAPNVSALDIPQNVIKHLMAKHKFAITDVPANFDYPNDDPSAGYASHSRFGYIDEVDDYHFQTKQINVVAQNPEVFLPEKVTQLGDVQYFSLSSPHLTDSLLRGPVKAKLLVHLPAAPSQEESVAWVYVHFVSETKRGKPALKQAQVSKVVLLPDRGGWTEINATEIVLHWLQDSANNKGLVIKANTDTNRNLMAGVNFQHSNLEIQEKHQNNRRKRNLGKVCNEETDAAETHCCLWPFEVDFEREYGWKFIIHPTKYQANFCSGDCRLGVMMPSNIYGHLIQQSNVSPCCTPQKMSGINMLYLDENHNVILGKLPKMRVERCGCA